MERKRAYDGDDSDQKRPARGGQIIKALCPNFVTGSVIGKNGEAIKGLKARTHAIINVAKAGQQFPGTDERPIAIKGDKAGMLEVVSFVQEKIYESEQVEEARKNRLKLLVPDTSAGRVIGRGGETVKRLRSTWGVDVTPSAKGETPKDLDERIVNLSGEWDNVLGCLDEILDMIVDDPKSIMELDLDYSKWEGFEPAPLARTPKPEGPQSGRDRGGPSRGRFPRGRPIPRGGHLSRGGPFPRNGLPPRAGFPRGRGRAPYRGGYNAPPRGAYGPPRKVPYDASEEDPYDVPTRGRYPRGGPAVPRRGRGFSRGYSGYDEGYGSYDDGYDGYGY